LDFDKNTDELEHQLKVLGQKIRIDILKKLNNSPIPLSFSSLQKEISTINHQATNFSFHLKTLKSADLIDSSQDGYEITNLGRRLLKSIISIEHVLNDVNKTIMIRTSRYTKEPFDNKKIEAYLINEGQMEPYRAKQIAQEVEERLSKTSIAYLTTPLMREYINAVLLENGLEEVRHKLTRLGSPPSDTLKFFRSEPFNPEQFIYRVGSEVSEQFLLLNLLPKDLSDLYLSGAILLLNLNAWGLRPLGFFLKSVI
jgi:DNA-binding HxlR family transcriptional regulator